MQEDHRIHDEYGTRLRLFVAARSRQRDDIDDITQETFLRFYAGRRDQDIQKPLGYLYRIAQNVIIDRSRRRSPLKTSVNIDDVAEYHLATRPRQEESRAMADLQRAYNDALSELSQRCAEVFHLRRHCEMTTPDVAAHLSITPRMVQKHMVAAMMHLHSRLRLYLSGDYSGESGDFSVPAERQIASSSNIRA